MLAAIMLATLAVDPRALLERARTLEQQNAPERSRYVAREDIKHTREQPDGRREQTSWQTFEAMIVEGRLRYRLVARSGLALPEREQKLQPEGKRSSFHWQQVLDHHDAALVGQETVGGRRAWRIRTTLRPGSPRPRKLSDLGLAGGFEFWIDEETGLERKMRFTVERAWASWSKGATIETWTTRVDRLFVIARTLVRNPNGKRIDETDQTYSNYRRFSSESAIRFETP